MKIASYQISQSAEQSSKTAQGEKQQQTLSLEESSLAPAAGEQLVLSSAAKLKYEATASTGFQSTSNIAHADGAQSRHHHESMLQSIISRQIEGTEAVHIISALGGEEVATLSGAAEIEFSEYRFYHQSQSAAVSFTGEIKTETGDTIGFSLHVNLSQFQQYEFEQAMRIERQPLTDPLVINFGADTVSLSSQVFQFDINSDGENETLSQLSAGSGFLVFDKNTNGQIDNGKELFGAETGNGFHELAYYDQDQNGWIDESDAIFHQLQLMVFDEQGNQALKTLSEVGVGAIYLGSEESAVDMADRSGRLLGAVKRTGLFLTENGQVKTIQEIDLANQRSQNLIAEPLPIVLARGERLPEIAQAETNLSFDANMMIERFDAIREQQRAYRKQFEELGESSELTFIKKLFEQFDGAIERNKQQGQQASKRYLSFF